MQETIEKLVRLQELDLERARLNSLLRALPSELAEARTTLTDAERRAADASAALAREDTLRTRLEREIAGHRQKATRFRTQLDSVKTPEQAAAIEHEIGFANAEAERLEEEEFASLERTEMQETVLAAARADVERLAGALEKTQARVSQRQQEYNDEIARVGTERDALRPLIAPEWLNRFDRLAATRGTGIARAENQQCNGCRMGVRPQTWNQLREGELLTCDSCGRLLYWDPAFMPPAKSPQPADSAVRKSKVAGSPAGA